MSAHENARTDREPLHACFLLSCAAADDTAADFGVRDFGVRAVSIAAYRPLQRKDFRAAILTALTPKSRADAGSRESARDSSRARFNPAHVWMPKPNAM